MDSRYTSRMLSRFRLGLLMLVAAVAACGQKGPLFLPDDESSEVLPAEDLADEDVSEGG